MGITQVFPTQLLGLSVTFAGVSVEVGHSGTVVETVYRKAGVSVSVLPPQRWHGNQCIRRSLVRLEKHDHKIVM